MLVRNYVRRLRMEASLRHLDDAEIPRGVILIPWTNDLVEHHAEVKWHCFHDSLDASIFPNLGQLEGCRYLMQAIAEHPGFVPEATWLARDADGDVGCIQGIRGAGKIGAIQNLGVLQPARGRGVGRALLQAAMLGFRDAGLKIAQLEVCARNTSAIALYHAVGFQTKKTLYREAQAAMTEYAI